MTFASSKESRCLSILTVEDVLKRISGQGYKSIVETARLYYKSDSNRYNQIKQNLNVVMFSGVFEGGKRADCLVEYNNLLILDLDHLEGNELARVKTCFISEPIICAFWVSPSGCGLKALVELDYLNSDLIGDFHSQAFNQLSEYLCHKYSIQLDKSGSNINRLCFMSYDPDLYCNSNPIAFKVTLNQPKTVDRIEALSHKARIPLFRGFEYKKLRHDRNKRQSREIIAAIIRYLQKNKKSITFSYEEWVTVAFAITETFNYDVGLKYFLALSELDGSPKYDKQACVDLLRYCYANSLGNVHLGTIIYMAKKQGFKTKRVLMSGN